MKYLICFFVFVMTCESVVAQERGPATDVDRLAKVFQEKFSEVFEQSKFPGGSAAIVLPNGKILTATAGKSNEEKDTDIKPSDRLMSASIGKTYFAAMAIELILAKKLSLDDKVSKYLGQQEWFKKIPNADDLTVQHLMRHQSGIPRYILNRQVWKDIMAEPDMKWTDGDQLKYIYDAKPLHQAGKGWAYSDTNYIILGLILQKISGQGVYEYVEKRFLKPNQLNDTIPNNRRQLPGLIQGYSSMFRGFGIPERTIEDGKFVFNPQMEWCGGGFLCTPSDLAKWAHVYFSGAAIKGDYLELLTKDAADSGRMLGRGSRYGLGVIIRETDLGTLLGHDGGFPGYSSTMGYFPKHKIAASFMYNTDARGAIRQRANTIMTDLVEAVVEAMDNE